MRHTTQYAEDLHSIRSPGWYVAWCEDCAWTTSGSEPNVEVACGDHEAEAEADARADSPKDTVPDTPEDGAPVTIQELRAACERVSQGFADLAATMTPAGELIETSRAVYDLGESLVTFGELHDDYWRRMLGRER